MEEARGSLGGAVGKTAEENDDFSCNIRKILVFGEWNGTPDTSTITHQPSTIARSLPIVYCQDVFCSS